MLTRRIQSVSGLLTATAIDDDDFEGNVLDPKWQVVTAGTGAALLINGYPNGVLRMRDSGAAGDNSSQISYGGLFNIYGSRFPDWISYVMLGVVAAASGARARAVAHNAGAYGAAGDWLGFEFAAAASPNWLIR